jgi:hypothetical protein
MRLRLGTAGTFVQQPPAGRGGGLANFNGATFTEMMTADLMTYRVLPGRQ